MNILFKSRLKKVLIAAILMGLVVACLLGAAAWFGMNSQDEFQVDGTPTTQFYFLLLVTFVTVCSAILLLGAAVSYFLSKSKDKS